MQEYDHPLLDEESFLYLPADVGDLKCDERVLVRELSLLHCLQLALVEMKVVLIQLEVLLFKFLVEVPPEIASKDLLAPHRNPGRVYGRDNGKNMYQCM